MSWIGYAIFGLVAGALARMLHPGKDPMNWFWTMLLGIGGAMVGGLIGNNLLGVRTDSGMMSWLAAIGGSVLLLVLYNYTTTRNLRSVDGPATTNESYKDAVFNDLAKGPRD